MTCPLPGDEVTRDDCHVDQVHLYTFDRLMFDCLAGRGLSVTDITLTGREDASQCPGQLDQELDDWSAYHRDDARSRDTN